MQAVSKKSSNHSIRFGTDGWRALIAEDFTYSNLSLVVNALSQYIWDNYEPGKQVIVGFDARFLADRFAKFAADIFVSWGIKVKFIDTPIPTPVIAHAAYDLDTYGALMFTASHNPPEYMGIKYIPEYGGPATVEITSKILKTVNEFSSDVTTIQKAKIELKGGHSEIFAAASLETYDPKKSYVDALKKIVDFDTLKATNAATQNTIVYDSLHGVGKGFVPSILDEAGFNVIAIHEEVDPTFGGSLPDPSLPQLGDLIKTVAERKANLGAANDGDADRFSFISSSGEFYPANKVLTCLYKYLVESKGLKGRVVRTISTTHLFDDIAAKFGFESVETPVGFKWLCEMMRQHDDIVLVAEESGGTSIQGHIPEKDGVLAILLTAQMLAETGKTLDQLWQDVQDFVGKEYFYDRLDLHLDGEKRDNFVAYFKDESLSEIAGFKVIKVDLTEGVKIYFDNGSWLLARPSGTEAMCRVYFEGNNKQELQKLAKAVSDLAKAS